jgi:hypothetical protein
MISGSQHTPPHFTVVPEKMEQLVQRYHEQKDKLHPFELAAQLHFQFVYIHIFRMGMGGRAPVNEFNLNAIWISPCDCQSCE